MYAKARRQGEASSTAVLLAVAISEEDQREVLSPHTPHAAF
ncbi:transposase-like protein [Salinibacter ruber]|nr:transposase-like protein [Salinibacter ruber]